jgi:hypothetical protein
MADGFLPREALLLNFLAVDPLFFLSNLTNFFQSDSFGAAFPWPFYTISGTLIWALLPMFQLLFGLSGLRPRVLPETAFVISIPSWYLDLILIRLLALDFAHFLSLFTMPYLWFFVYRI